MKQKHNYNIEKPLVQHLPALAAFIATLNAEPQHHVGYCGGQSDEIMETLATDFEIVPALDCFVVAWEGDTLIGAMGFEPDFDTGLAEIWGPFVASGDPNLATALYAAVLERMPVQIKRLGFFINHLNSVGMGLCAHLGAVVKSDERIFKCRREDFESVYLAGATAVPMEPLESQLPLEPQETPEVMRLSLPLRMELEKMHNQLFKDSYIRGKALVERLDENHALFAELDGDMVSGYIDCEAEIDYSSAQIEFLGVNAQYRSKGIGNRLLVRALEWLFYAKNHQGIDVVRLCVNADNTGATRLYERLGFKLCHRMVYAVHEII